MSLFWGHTLRGLVWQKESLVVPFLSNISLLSATNPPCATEVLVGSGVELKDGLETCLAFLWCGRCQTQNLLMLEKSPIIDVTQWTPGSPVTTLGLLLQMSWFIFWLPGIRGSVYSFRKPDIYTCRVHRNYNHCSLCLLFFSLFNGFLVSKQTTLSLPHKNDGLHTFYGLVSCAVWYQPRCLGNVDKGDQTALSGIWGWAAQMIACSCSGIHSQKRATLPIPGSVLIFLMWYSIILFLVSKSISRLDQDRKLAAVDILLRF